MTNPYKEAEKALIDFENKLKSLPFSKHEIDIIHNELILFKFKVIYKLEHKYNELMRREDLTFNNSNLL